jgi:ketosteroid isomerase-like protein
MNVADPMGKDGVGKEEDAPVSVQEDNKALVRHFLEELAKGNYDLVDELLSPDFVDCSLMPGQEPDREGYKRGMAEMNAPFSDISITIDEQVAEGDKVMT